MNSTSKTDPNIAATNGININGTPTSQKSSKPFIIFLCKIFAFFMRSTDFKFEFKVH